MPVRVAGKDKMAVSRQIDDDDYTVSKRKVKGSGKKNLEAEEVIQSEKEVTGTTCQENSREKKEEEIDQKSAEITQHIQELCSNFTPSACKKCLNRNADRICVNQSCGEGTEEGFASLICGKCHLDEHSQHDEKPELDVDEFFIKLSTFLNTTKADQNASQQGINLDLLQGALSQIDSFLESIDRVEETFKKELIDYVSPEQASTTIEECISKVLSNPTFENVSEQIAEIDSNINFEDNAFSFLDHKQKPDAFRNQIKRINSEAVSLQKTIVSSFFGRKQLDLDLIYISQQQQPIEPVFTKRNGKVNVQTAKRSGWSQCYLDQTIHSNKKYVLRFTALLPCSAIYIGITPKSMKLIQYHYYNNSTLKFIFKKFFLSYPQTDCSMVVKGKAFGSNVKANDQYEMRICINENLLEFCTLPKYDNVNSKLIVPHFEPNEDYIISICTQNDVSITFDSLEECFTFPEY